MARPTATAAARSASGGRGASSNAARRRPPRRPLPRRLTGPAGGAAAAALPGRVLRAPFARAARSRASVLLDALLQGRAWIALLTVLLVGIVFFNVDLLKLNRDIAHSADKAERIKRENAALELELARLGSSERIQKLAAARGLELPAPGQVRYLRLNPFVDARNAANTVTAPNALGMTPVPSPAATAASAPAATAPQPTATPSPTTPQGAPPASSGPATSAPAASSPGPAVGGAAPAATAHATPGQ